MPDTTDTASMIDRVKAAGESDQLSSSAVDNILTWLTDERYSSYVPEVERHIEREMWNELDDVFWTVIPFGTGGRRGRMYPIGCNAINDRTIGESAQGLADYVIESKPDGPWSAAIAYDTRHRSREFAELCAGILVAAGFKVYFIDQIRSTPELSFLIRLKNCDCGIMVTASHNPPSDNAVKVYWSSGVQLVPPHDKAVIGKVGEVQKIEAASFEESVANGDIEIVTAEADAALLKQHLQHSARGPANLKVIYSPLHGVGEFNVKSLLHEVGFTDLEIYGPHREPSGDFPNVPGNVSNPENREVFTAIIEHARETGGELILATDPDCDRMGAAAPVTTDLHGEWEAFDGNQLGVLLADFVLSQRQQHDSLKPSSYIVTTLVTTRMLRRMADTYGVRCFDNNLVGFKWICSEMDKQGPDDFVFGCEESHGYLVGQYCRDKDGAVACMLMSELAAWVKSQGVSMFEHLDQLYLKHGYHAESLITIRMEGSDGMTRMQNLMNGFRAEAPRKMGGLDVTKVQDYLNGDSVSSAGATEQLDGPTGNLIIIETGVEGNYVAARPSGTEPKVKFYLFTYVPPTEITDLAICKSEMNSRLAGFRADLEAFAQAF